MINCRGCKGKTPEHDTLEGYCMLCASQIIKGQDNARLVAENTRLKERIKKLEAENDKFKDALVRIGNWAKAYPLDVFLKPDLTQAAKVLKAAGMTLDAISADAMRHVIDGVKNIVGLALKG